MEDNELVLSNEESSGLLKKLNNNCEKYNFNNTKMKNLFSQYLKENYQIAIDKETKATKLTLIK